MILVDRAKKNARMPCIHMPFTFTCLPWVVRGGTMGLVGRKGIEAPIEIDPRAV